MSQPSHMVDQMITATELRLLASIADTTYGSKANKYKAARIFWSRPRSTTTCPSRSNQFKARR